ncbi:hypothetical protein A0J61_11397, partial [Choanephora cucurbitarum]
MLPKKHSRLTDNTRNPQHQFRTHSFLWSEHCGIVSLNPNIEIAPEFISIDQR